MKISNALKQRLTFIGFQVAFGQLRDKDVLIATLEAFLEQLRFES